jgi:hypothetical protein
LIRPLEWLVRALVKKFDNCRHAFGHAPPIVTRVFVPAF